MDNHPFNRTIDTIEQFREVIPPPSGISVDKVLDHMDEHIKTFIQCSPYVVISTSGKNGYCDASPRGGEPGFVKIIDDKHLLLAEARGNQRADSLVNLIENPFIGMLFLVPGFDETLRLNGRVVLTQDPDLLGPSIVPNGPPPIIGIGISVIECYLHCAKASIRSSIWNPMGWPNLLEFPTAAEIFQAHGGGELSNVRDMQALLDENYANSL